MALRRLVRGRWLFSSSHQLEQRLAAAANGVTSRTCLSSVDGFQQQRCMARMVKMVLIKDHPNLGKAGDIVEVKPGHGRMDLYPKQHAVYATPENVQRYAKAQHDKEEAAAAHGLTIDDILNKLATKQLVASRRSSWRSGDEQRMVGQVTKQDIVDLVRKQLHIELPSSQLLMDGSIQQFGHFKVPLNLRFGRGKQVELMVEVQRVRRIR